MTDDAHVRRTDHWQGRYSDNDHRTLSWFQADPALSLRLIRRSSATAVPVVDVGGGASGLAGELTRLGWSDVTVIDISSAALDIGRGRVTEPASVTWIEADVLSWWPDRTFGVWHDRAVFHFLVDQTDRDRYRAALRAAIPPGGHVVLATFAEDGPVSCSGLPVERYDAPALAAAVGDPFTVVESLREEHRTPSGAVQPFTWVRLRRTA